MEKQKEKQIEMSLLELSDSLGYRKETIAWVWSAIVRASGKSSSQSNLTATDVCCALMSEANETRGGSIEYILQLVGVPTSEDVGKIVIGLVGKGLVNSQPNESISDFDQIYNSNSLSGFLNENGIKRKRFKFPPIYTSITWLFYIVGVLLVLVSYVSWVNCDVAWVGWCVGMVGLGMSYYRPTNKKYPNE